jgi:hypothetical protein
MAKSVAVEEGGQGLDGSERERVIRKIKRCLALGESSNPNEAEMAMRQAQALMRTYRLSEADLDADAVNSEQRDTGLVRLSEWQRMLASAAAKAFGCRLLMSHVRGGPVQFSFVGMMPAAELAAYAYDALLVQIKAARKALQAKYKVTRKQSDDFCHGWVYAVLAKIDKFSEDNTISASQEHALMVIEQKESAAIDAWIASRHGDIGTRAQAKREFDKSAAYHGFQMGQNAKIHQPVASRSTGDGPLLLGA